MKIKLDKGAFLPVREHETDAGMDIRALKGVRIPAKSNMVVHTGIHIQLPPKTCGLLVAKSGLNVKNSILTTGLIDEGYTGEIVVNVYNHGDNSYMIMAGDKITQLVILPCYYEQIEIVDSLEENTDRGSNGFGSTGR